MQLEGGVLNNRVGVMPITYSSVNRSNLGVSRSNTSVNRSNTSVNRSNTSVNRTNLGVNSSVAFLNSGPSGNRLDIRPGSNFESVIVGSEFHEYEEINSAAAPLIQNVTETIQ